MAWALCGNPMPTHGLIPGSRKQRRIPDVRCAMRGGPHCGLGDLGKKQMKRRKPTGSQILFARIGKTGNIHHSNRSQGAQKDASF